jgi:hypothetical protein
MPPKPWANAAICITIAAQPAVICCSSGRPTTLSCAFATTTITSGARLMYAVRRGLSNGQSAELVGVAEPIARCGEGGGIGRWCEMAQRRMRTLVVVVGEPGGDLGAGVVEVEEQHGMRRPEIELPTELCHGLPRQEGRMAEQWEIEGASRLSVNSSSKKRTTI